jgi:hypothetical protein
VTSLTRTPESARGVLALRWLALWLVPFLVLLVQHWNWAVPVSSGDYAQYLLHARALVEGRPYTDTGYIYDPAASLIGPPVYPPGLPLTLAPLVALGGVHSVLVRLLMPVSVLLFAALSTWRLAREVEPWQAAVGGAFTAYAIEASLGTLAPLSDPGFAVLVWASVLMVDREGRWTWRRATAVTALGFAAIAYRTAGVALIPALLIYALLRRRTLGTLPFAAPLLWMIAGAAALLAGLVRIPFTDRMARSVDNLGEHIDTFARQYRIAFADAQLYPFANATANDIYHIVASLLALAGLTLLLSRARRTFLGPFAAAYGALLLFAPVAEPRYAWPLYPLVGAALAHGSSVVVRTLARTVARRTQTLLTMLPLVAALLIALVGDLRRAPPASFVMHPDARALFAWLTQQDPAAPHRWRVAYINPRVLTLETRVPAMGIVPRTAPGILSAFKRSRATHFVWQGAGRATSCKPSPRTLPGLFHARVPEPHIPRLPFSPASRCPRRPRGADQLEQVLTNAAPTLSLTPIEYRS